MINAKNLKITRPLNLKKLLIMNIFNEKWTTLTRYINMTLSNPLLLFISWVIFLFIEFFYPILLKQYNIPWNKIRKRKLIKYLGGCHVIPRNKNNNKLSRYARLWKLAKTLNQNVSTLSFVDCPLIVSRLSLPPKCHLGEKNHSQSLKRTFPLSPTITWRTELTNWSNTKKPNSFKEAILISGEFLRASNSFVLPLCNSNTGSINRILGLDHRIAGFSDLKMASGQPSIATQMFSDQCSWSITSKTNFTVQICSLRIQLNKFK